MVRPSSAHTGMEVFLSTTPRRPAPPDNKPSIEQVVALWHAGYPHPLRDWVAAHYPSHQTEAQDVIEMALATHDISIEDALHYIDRYL